ncbi:hypothetical protein KW786_03320 [Candidatus Parcubacteria bacterium]|nr:hypothetical protein [Candidatus Parcubacteria bacterium]
MEEAGEEIEIDLLDVVASGPDPHEDPPSSVDLGTVAAIGPADPDEDPVVDLDEGPDTGRLDFDIADCSPEKKEKKKPRRYLSDEPEWPEWAALVEEHDLDDAPPPIRDSDTDDQIADLIFEARMEIELKTDEVFSRLQRDLARVKAGQRVPESRVGLIRRIWRWLY